MKRSSFLRALAALPAAAFGLAATSPEPAETPFERELRFAEGKRQIETGQLLLDLAERHTGFRPARARVLTLARTGDASKYAVVYWDNTGRMARKNVLVSEPAVAGRRSELAYQLTKRAQEAAIDLAHMNGWDWRPYQYAANHGLR
jgi:hypothetical protein